MPNHAFYTRNLPHIQPSGATFFVTMRLAGSMPVAVIKHLKAVYQEKRKSLAKKEGLDLKTLEKGELSKSFRDKIHLLQFEYFLSFDEALDQMNEPYHLQNQEVMEVVSEAIAHRDGKVLESYAYCIMPNHLHWIFRLFEDAPVLWAILRDFKKFTGREANLVLNRKGAFWAEESFDHVVRHETSLDQKMKYVLNNPVKAGLVDDWRNWPGTKYAESLTR